MSYGHAAPEVETQRRERRTPARGQAKGPTKRGPGTPGARLSDAKRKERERRQRGVRLRRAALGIAVLALGAGLVVGIVALYRAPIFTIETVSVTGAKHHTADEIRRVAAVPSDATLVRLPSDEIRERLEADPWISAVTLDRDYPSTLHVNVSERTAIAVVEVDTNERWLVSKDGYWLERVGEDGSDLAAIIDLKQVTPRRGGQVREPELANAIKVLGGLGPKLRKAVVAVSAPSVDETALRTRRDVEIFVGEAVSMATKDRIVLEILDREDGVVYINVRVIDRPTWRGLEAE